MKTTQVLIVGAGPTGLMMGAQLNRFGISSLIIDKKDGVTLLSKALGLQARSMEIYEQLGVVDTALEQGYISEGARVIVKNKDVGYLSFGRFAKGQSSHPYLFILEQSKNEQILYDFYRENGGQVLWNCEFLGYEGDEDGVTVTVNNEDGEIETIRTRYLVGADGAHSPVRHQLEVAFEGGTYEGLFLVADTKIKWDRNYGDLTVAFSNQGFGAFFPMAGERRYRFISLVPDEYAKQEGLTFDMIKEVCKSKLDIPIEFEETDWFATYKVHHRTVSQFSKGRVFLAGDSAHIHSPAGGQGMNTGLQDAYNLAWKMALVINTQAGEQLLDTYNEERQPIAVNLINSTDQAFKAIAGNGWFSKFARMQLFPLVAGFLFGRSATRRALFRAVSQIRINYRGKSLSSGKVGKLVGGNRFPYFEYQNGTGKKHVFELLNTAKFVMLTWGDADKAAIQQYLNTHNLSNLIEIATIPKDEATTSFFKGLGINGDFCCLLRPDMHIAWVSKTFKEADFEGYLKEQLGLVF